MKSPLSSLVRTQNGNVTIVVTFLMVPLLLLCAFAFDVGALHVARTQLQAAADAGALAVLGEFRGGGSRATAENEGISIGSQHKSWGDPVDLTGAVEFGAYDFVNRVFMPGALAGVPAVRVTARDDGVDLFFDGLVGHGAADVSAQAVATIGTRDILIVQDKTQSFIAEINDAKVAIHTLIDGIVNSGVAGDRFGLVEFAGAANRLLDLSDMPGAQGAAHAAASTINACQSVGPQGGPCYGTDIAVGLREGINTFLAAPVGAQAEKVVVLVSDGTPCYPASLAQTNFRRAEAIAAADEVDAAGISLFAVYLNVPGSSACNRGPNDGRSFIQGLVRGFGQFYETPNAADLDQILLTILNQMPLRLVK